MTKGTRVKVPATEMSNSPEIIRMPTPIAAIAVTGTCCIRMAMLPKVAKRSCSGAIRLQPTTTTSSARNRMTMLIAW